MSTVTEIASSTTLGTDAHRETRDDARYLFNPVVDFLCLGGGSLIVLATLAMAAPKSWIAPVSMVAFLLAHVVNNPHFAHSYQIFYRGYAAKAFGWATPAPLRARYIIAGIIVPVLLVAFFGIAVARGNIMLLGAGINIMGFFVGWHYVKQGYGMIIVDSVLKKNLFSTAEKRALLINAYAVWATSWLYINHTVKTSNFWGLESIAFDVPLPLVIVSGALTMLSSIGALIAIAHRRRYATGRPFPVAGAAAYIASLYVWLLVGRVDPMLLLIVPLFHSLQYLVVVWRFELNRQNARPRSDTQTQAWHAPAVRFTLFAVMGLFLGYMGFWGLPTFLDRIVGYDKALFGGTLFLFLFYIFINVHHYFMDNVMWRRENPEIGRHLFTSR